ncbi:UNVERIFIED_CONTAM: hypothetical protein O8I53_11700 [Campylobacter lari]
MLDDKISHYYGVVVAFNEGEDSYNNLRNKYRVNVNDMLIKNR